MKTTTESHVKNERNHLQARQASTQLQNATATANGQEGILVASQQNKKLQRTLLTWICQAKHSSEEANEPAPQQRTDDSENEESSQPAKRIHDNRGKRNFECLTQGSESSERSAQHNRHAGESPRSDYGTVVEGWLGRGTT